MDVPSHLPEFVRVFAAIEIDDDLRRRLGLVQASLKRAAAHVSWVPMENVHVSLAFLGDVPSDRVPWIAEALDEAARSTAPFCFDVADIGTFGGGRSPRVIWAGVRNGDALVAFQARATDLLDAVGCHSDARAYTPHLTLGRVRSARNRNELLEALAAVGPIALGRVTATRTILFRSELMPSGARYSVLHAAPLSGPLNLLDRSHRQ